MSYSATRDAIINRTANWQTTLATELALTPPVLSANEREAIKLLASIAPGTSGAYESLTGARTLTVDDVGKVFGLNLAAGFTVTLPLISTLPANWSCEFCVETAPTSDYVVIANATDLDKMAGHVLSSSGGAEDSETTAAGDQVNFISAAGASKVGDWLRVRTNGVSWFVRAECATAAAITITG